MTFSLVPVNQLILYFAQAMEFEEMHIPVKIEQDLILLRNILSKRSENSLKIKYLVLIFKCFENTFCFKFRLDNATLFGSSVYTPPYEILISYWFSLRSDWSSSRNFNIWFNTVLLLWNKICFLSWMLFCFLHSWMNQVWSWRHLV